MKFENLIKLKKGVLMKKIKNLSFFLLLCSVVVNAAPKDEANRLLDKSSKDLNRKGNLMNRKTEEKKLKAVNLLLI